MLTRENLISEYRDMIDHGLFGGLSIEMYLRHIEILCAKYFARSLLDYGCGGAKAWADGSLQDKLGLEVLRLYDPAIPKFSERPERTFDGVLCVDVLEHVPEQDVPEVVADLFSYAERFVFAAVCCRPAKRTFADGTNVHVTIKPIHWWQNIFESAAGGKKHVLIQSP